MNMLLARRKDIMPRQPSSDSAAWCARWRARARTTMQDSIVNAKAAKLTLTQQLALKAVARAEAKGDVEQKAFF